MRQIGERAGLAKFMKLTETQGDLRVAPARRLPDGRAGADLGVVDHRCEAFGNEGLFCMDSSAIPTSLGVNPSLTIAAVCERAAARARRAARPTMGCRRRRPASATGTPGRVVGERVVPGPRASAARADVAGDAPGGGGLATPCQSSSSL